MATPAPPDESRWSETRRPTTDEDRSAYERDCLAHVRRRFRSGRPDDRHDVREVWLEGSGPGNPDTRIKVRWFDRFYEREHVESYPVWWSIFTASDGGVVVPSQVALLVHTWVYESQPKPPSEEVG